MVQTLMDESETCSTAETSNSIAATVGKERICVVVNNVT